MFKSILKILLAPLAAIWGGYVLTVLWEWFVVPVFGLPQLGIAQGLGLWLVVGYLTHQVSWQKEADELNDVSVETLKMINPFLSPALTLFIGWVYTLFL
jgi:hypothetical protein